MTLEPLEVNDNNEMRQNTSCCFMIKNLVNRHANWSGVRKVRRVRGRTAHAEKYIL